MVGPIRKTCPWMEFPPIHLPHRETAYPLEGGGFVIIEGPYDPAAAAQKFSILGYNPERDNRSPEANLEGESL